MKKFICIIILIISLIFLYAKFIEPYNFVIHEYMINNKNVPQSFEGTKIVHFSDLLYHKKYNDTYLNKVMKEIKNSNSDILVFTGDLLKEKINEAEKEKLITLLSQIKPKLYKYAILGDKDNADSKEILEKSNFIILDNDSKYIFYNGNEPIVISGGSNLTSESLPADENITYNYKIALIHKPDDYDKINNTYNLVLAGHSNGGEIKLPFIGSIINPKGAKKYTSNYYINNDSLLYISNGLGSNKTNLRLLNTPSINVYRLYSK